MRRKLLARFTVDAQLEAEFERSGLLDVVLGDTKPDATVESQDGNRTIVGLAPSGEVAWLLVQDYASGESRSIPFPFGTIDIVAEADEIAVFLVPAASCE